MSEFNSRLGQAIAASGLKQAALGAATDQAPASISQWRTGARPKPGEEVVRRLAEALEVPFAWLDAGDGPVPARLRSKELERVEGVQWVPSLVRPDGARSGGNAALYAIQPTLDTVVREALQNSSDVGLGGGPVEVDIRLLGLAGTARTRFLDALRWPDLRTHIEASISSSTGQQVATALKEGLDIDDGGELLVLLISDYNTVGLTGPERNTFGDEGNFAALTRDTLFSRKDSDTAGGSYGLGKFTGVAASSINTVLYLSDLSEPTDEGNQVGRFIGRAELVWHPDPDPDSAEDPACDGPMWLGDTTPKDWARSHWAEGGDPLVQDLRLHRRSNSSGTTMGIVALRALAADGATTPEDMVAALRASVSRWFFAAIEDGRLTVNVDYLQLSDAPDGRDPDPVAEATVRPERTLGVSGMVLAHRAGRAGDVVDALVDDGEVIEVKVPLHVPAMRDGHAAFTHNATLLVRRSTAEENPDANGKIALMRGSRMVVRYLDASRAAVGAREFQGVLLAGTAADDSQEGRWAEQFLRASEPPSHDHWMYTESVRLRYKAGGKKALADFEKAIRDATRSAVIKDVETDANGPRDLARRFRFGSPPDPVRAPRLVVDDQQLLENGAWEIKGTVRLPKGRVGVTRGAPRLTFAGESGKRSTIKWDSVIAVKDCAIEDDRVLVIPPEVRSARFRATTNPSSNPVPATDAAVIVSFNVIEVNA